MHLSVIWNRWEYFIFRHWKTVKISITLYRTFWLSATHPLSHPQVLLGCHSPSCHRPISSSPGITSKIPTASYCTGMGMYRNALTHSLDLFIFQHKINRFTELHYRKEGWSIQLHNKFSPHTSWMKSQDSRGIRTFWLSSICDFLALGWGCWIPISASLGISREIPTLGPVQARCCLCCSAGLGASVCTGQA